MKLISWNVNGLRACLTHDFAASFAALDADERVVHLLRDLADLAVVEDHGAAVVFHFADGRDDRRRAGAEGLSQRAARMGVEQLLHGDAALLGLIAHVLCELEDALAGDASKDAALERRGDDLAVDDEHHVHRADFLDILVLTTVQPEHLIEAARRGVKGCLEGGGVVAAGLGSADAALDGADIVLLDVDAQRLNAVFIVRTAGGADDDVDKLLRRMDAQLRAARDHHRTQIERGSLGRGDPVLLGPDELLHGLDLEFRVERGHAQTLGAAVHT